MSLPTGYPKNLPTPGTLADFSKNVSPGKSVAVATTTAYDLTDVLEPCATDFFCQTSGNLVAVLAGDGTTTHTYAVAAGNTYRGLWAAVDSTSTAVGLMRQ